MTMERYSKQKQQQRSQRSPGSLALRDISDIAPANSIRSAVTSEDRFCYHRPPPTAEQSCPTNDDITTIGDIESVCQHNNLDMYNTIEKYARSVNRPAPAIKSPHVLNKLQTTKKVTSERSEASSKVLFTQVCRPKKSQNSHPAEQAMDSEQNHIVVLETDTYPDHNRKETSQSCQSLSFVPAEYCENDQFEHLISYVNDQAPFKPLQITQPKTIRLDLVSDDDC